MTESLLFDFGGVLPSVTATPANPSPMPCLTVFFRGASYGYAGVLWGDGEIAPAGGVASLPPYTATYTAPDGTATSFDVGKNGRPPHWWGTRWRTSVPGLNGTPLVIKNTLAWLKANDYIPNYRDISPNTPPPAKPIATYNFPLDPGAVTKSQGNTGERFDIGDDSEYDTYGAMTGDLTSAIAYNESLNGTSMFFLSKGKFWDFIANAPYIAFPKMTLPPVDATKQISWDTGHNPMAGRILAYVTEDPWYLEMIQANAQMAITFGGDFRYGLEWPPGPKAGHVATWPVGQIRGYNYCGRNILAALMATKFFEERSILPDTCLPSSIYLTQFNNQAQAADYWWMSNPAISIFGFHPTYDLPSPWQSDKGGPVLAQAARYSPGMKKYAEWNFRNLWLRVSGISGWPPCLSSLYCLPTGSGWNMNPPFENKNGNMMNPKALTTSQFFKNGVEMWAYAYSEIKKVPGGAGNITDVQADAAQADQWNGGNWIQELTFDHTIQHTAFSEYVDAMRRGEIDLSQYAPVWMIEQAYANQHAMAQALEASGWIFPARQSAWVDPIYKPNFNIKPGQPYPTPVPVDGSTSPPTPPPATGVFMPTARSIKIGETVSLPIVSNPSDADLSSLTLKTVPDGIVSAALVKDANGRPASVTVKGLAAGLAKVIGDVNGLDAGGAAAVIEGECDVTVTAPLPLARGLTIG